MSCLSQSWKLLGSIVFLRFMLTVPFPKLQLDGSCKGASTWLLINKINIHFNHNHSFLSGMALSTACCCTFAFLASIKKERSGQRLRRMTPKTGSQSLLTETSFQLLQIAPTDYFANQDGSMPFQMFRSVLPNFSPAAPAKAFLARLVLMQPGIRLHTRTPKGFSSERKLSRMPMKACLEPP